LPERSHITSYLASVSAPFKDPSILYDRMTKKLDPVQWPMPVAQSNGTEVWELPGVQPYLQLVAEMHLSISNDGSAAPS
jgi:hypothetical protein